MVGIPKGTRDFNVTEMVRRNYIFNTVKEVFELYGFSPIETPAMENLSTLMGKYGEEGDKLIFKILNSGDFMGNIDMNNKENLNSKKIAVAIAEKALRYDLTVPFARFVVQHQNEITFPFRRYQIQPVWRADRPQKGRYREFYQCDVDVVGSNSLLNEYELIQIIDDVFGKLGINVTIKLNNRKILSGIAEVIDESERLTDITVAIDKLDKIGIDNVKEELKQKGLTEEKFNLLKPVILLSGTNEEKLEKLKDVFKNSSTGTKGVEELNTILEHIKISALKQAKLEIDISLARGLNYYTGAIFEVKARDVSIGSICGGGRYDDLTGIFGLKNVSGVGISFGADRIYDVLTELNLFPESSKTTTKILFINFGGDEEKYCLKLLKEIRLNGINAEIYPVNAKIKKQMEYSNNKGINFVALAGTNEMNENKVTLKNMISGEQELLNISELIEKIK
ncbi:MAG: histidine--tRNA ligase [Bacteroidota bacterium]|nr:histidine--tRNA ligase [Bacteroidota bacterium]